MLFLRALHPRYKSIVDLFASKQRDISVASINSIILDARFIDEFNFFGSNGNPAPVCDDPLDTASQLESIDDDAYPPAQAPLDEFNPLFCLRTRQTTTNTQNNAIFYCYLHGNKYRENRC